MDSTNRAIDFKFKYSTNELAIIGRWRLIGPVQILSPHDDSCFILYLLLHTAGGEGRADDEEAEAGHARHRDKRKRTAVRHTTQTVLFYSHSLGNVYIQIVKGDAEGPEQGGRAVSATRAVGDAQFCWG